jgi:hypothetical protein
MLEAQLFNVSAVPASSILSISSNTAQLRSALAIKEVPYAPQCEILPHFMQGLLLSAMLFVV